MVIDEILGHIRSGQTRQVVQALAELPENHDPQPAQQEEPVPVEKSPELNQMYSILADEVSAGRMSLKEAQNTMLEWSIFGGKKSADSLLGAETDDREKKEADAEYGSQLGHRVISKAWKVGLGGTVGGAALAAGGAALAAGTGGLSIPLIAGIGALAGGLGGTGVGAVAGERENAKLSAANAKFAKEKRQEARAAIEKDQDTGGWNALKTTALLGGGLALAAKAHDIYKQEKHRRNVLAQMNPVLQYPPSGMEHMQQFAPHPAHMQSQQMPQMQFQPHGHPMSPHGAFGPGMRGMLGEELMDKAIEQVLAEARAKREARQMHEAEVGKNVANLASAGVIQSKDSKGLNLATQGFQAAQRDLNKKRQDAAMDPTLAIEAASMMDQGSPYQGSVNNGFAI